jgi:hypothetical protein
MECGDSLDCDEVTSCSPIQNGSIDQWSLLYRLQNMPWLSVCASLSAQLYFRRTLSVQFACNLSTYSKYFWRHRTVLWFSNKMRLLMLQLPIMKPEDFSTLERTAFFWVITQRVVIISFFSNLLWDFLRNGKLFLFSLQGEVLHLFALHVSAFCILGPTFESLYPVLRYLKALYSFAYRAYPRLRLILCSLGFVKMKVPLSVKHTRLFLRPLGL